MSSVMHLQVKPIEVRFHILPKHVYCIYYMLDILHNFQNATNSIYTYIYIYRRENGKVTQSLYQVNNWKLNREELLDANLRYWKNAYIFLCRILRHVQQKSIHLKYENRTYVIWNVDIKRQKTSSIGYPFSLDSKWI